MITFFCGAAVAAGASLLVAGVLLFLEVLSFPDPDSGVCSLFDLREHLFFCDFIGCSTESERTTLVSFLSNTVNGCV